MADECIHLIEFRFRKKLRLANEKAKTSVDEELEKIAEKLDRIVGLCAPNQATVVDRLRIGVDGVSLLQEEMLSLQVSLILLMIDVTFCCGAEAARFFESVTETGGKAFPGQTKRMETTRQKATRKRSSSR